MGNFSPFFPKRWFEPPPFRQNLKTKDIGGMVFSNGKGAVPGPEALNVPKGLEWAPD